MILTFTHKGWLGICPVYYSGLNTAEPIAVYRHWVFQPLMWLSELGFIASIWIYSWIDPNYEPSFGLLVTGRLREPKRIGSVD